MKNFFFLPPKYLKFNRRDEINLKINNTRQRKTQIIWEPGIRPPKKKKIEIHYENYIEALVSTTFSFFDL